MAQYHHHSIGIKITPKPVDGTQVGLQITPQPLQLAGFNIPVEISTASAFRQQPSPQPLNSLTVMAHVDTGANITSIDVALATHLNLKSMGMIINQTAAGRDDRPTFAIDLIFPNTKLAPFNNLRIGSCDLNFNVEEAIKNPNDFKNFGILLGRDVMSRWTIIWNGPTSTVIVSD